MRYAVIDNDSKEVVNVIIWQGAPWEPPANHFIIQSDEAGIDDIYDENTQTFIRPS
jgi:hypothetical protein